MSQLVKLCTQLGLTADVPKAPPMQSEISTSLCGQSTPSSMNGTGAMIESPCSSSSVCIAGYIDSGKLEEAEGAVRRTLQVPLPLAQWAEASCQLAKILILKAGRISIPPKTPSPFDHRLWEADSTLSEVARSNCSMETFVAVLELMGSSAQVRGFDEHALTCRASAQRLMHAHTESLRSWAALQKKGGRAAAPMP